MEILQLKYFCHAAETENFSHTAYHFGVPASNISQCIKRLETEIGSPLFARGHNSLKLNENGKIFYEKISKALAIIDDAKAGITKDTNKKELKICATTNRELVMHATEVLRTTEPDVKIVVSHNYSDSEEYDLIIADDMPCPDGYTRSAVVTENMVLAVNKKNPLSKKTEISTEDIECENFVSLTSESSMYKATIEMCRKMNFAPNIVIQSPDSYYVRKCVELNLGITFYPEFSWKDLFSDNIEIFHIGDYKRTTYAYVKKYEKNKYVKRLLEHIKF